MGSVIMSTSTDNFICPPRKETSDIPFHKQCVTDCKYSFVKQYLVLFCDMFKL